MFPPPVLFFSETTPLKSFDGFVNLIEEPGAVVSILTAPLPLLRLPV